MAISQQDHIFIDPEECGSSVGYYLNLGDYTQDKKTTYTLSGVVVLADCNHKIDWAFHEGDLDKIDAAIRMLQKFRRDFVAMEKQVAQLNGGA